MPRNTAMLSARDQLLISEDVTNPETSMKREISVNSSWRVIIVGGGFGGLRAAQALKLKSVGAVPVISRAPRLKVNSWIAN
jgi:hypothetical protein